MKTLYIECGMGAAGDMLTAALLELIPDRQAFLEKMNALFPGVEVSAEKSESYGLAGIRIDVRVNGVSEEEYCQCGRESGEGITNAECRRHIEDHSHGEDHEHTECHTHSETHNHSDTHAHLHTGMVDIRALIDSIDVPDGVKADAAAVYSLIAEAESYAHGKPVSMVHFHEVGALDAVADIVGASLLIRRLAPERVVVSPIHVGSGHVRCAHGLLPVPAPATARILTGVPIYSGNIQGELCTPTGAALLKHFASEFGGMPLMRVQKTGRGIGSRDIGAANCLRVFLGDADECTGEDIFELACNLDDMTPEAIGFAMKCLFEEGALDVFTQQIGMKKCRPGVKLSCLCRAEEKDALTRQMFIHTTTLGVREYALKRQTLARSERRESTPAGEIRIKSARGWGVDREKPEYEDIARIARERGISLAEAERFALKERR